MKPEQQNVTTVTLTPTYTLESVLTSTAKIAYKLLKGWMLLSAAQAVCAASSKETALGNICLDARITTVNKPGFEIASFEGNLVPKSCTLFGASSQQCHADFQAHLSFKSDLQTWDQLRVDSKQAYDAWRKDHKSNVNQMVQQLSGQELTAFNTLAVGVNQLMSFHFISDAATKYQKGACGEHTAIMILDIIQQDLAQGTSTQIQEVIFQSSKRQYHKDHTYLILNADLADVTIKDDATAVAAHFASASRGRVCDAWNRVDRTLDASGAFYTNAEGEVWDSVKIKTVTSVSSLKTCYDALPAIGQSFIRQMCAGRDLLLQAICGAPSVSPKMEL